ncbi:hypothetical protein ACFQ4X_07130 [Fictibacillus halophilus]|uniref:hypothetical protein n=1 Tax=Fictibacillus halophilus TaxID=1610490 RepID=UPI00362C7265
MWLLISTITILLIIIYIMPKNITKSEAFFSVFFSMGFQQLVDCYLDFKYDLYGYFSVGVEVLLFLFPAFKLVFINFFPFGLSVYSKVKYILFWTVFSTLYEYGSLYTSLFYYHGWRIEWSFAMYPVIFSINGYVFYLFRKWKAEEIKEISNHLG